ncbi:hypothetical protein M1349_01135 [Patescibacteria group bacterium]|nr:hypothetical protein [Patescibacteria group bacterium]
MKQISRFNKSLIVFFLIIVIVSFVYFKINKTNSLPPEKPLASSENIQTYYDVYKNPFVLYLRKAINAYTNNDSLAANLTISAVRKEKMDGVISGLDSFDRNYYKSKFVVLTINDSVSGGKDIQILFQDKPDRIFYAWVYKLSNGDYELRGFNSKENFDREALDKVVSEQRSLILDKKHSL